MRQTIQLDASRAQELRRAAEILREGGLVAFATETVYGLGANALLPEAVAGVFAAKKRPGWDPLIVHLAGVEQLAQVADVPTELAGRVQALAEAFWPGPLTLLLPRAAAVPDAVTAGRPLVGVRVPAHPCAQALLAEAGVPVAAPSANLFGHISPTTAAHVLVDLEGRIDAVLDGGATTIGVESTVLDPAPTPMVLYRPGAVTPAQVEAATGVAVRVYVAEESPGGGEAPGQTVESMPSPGLGGRHYAPRARLLLTGPTVADLQSAVAAAQVPCGVLLPSGWSLQANAQTHIQPWAAWDDPAGLAATLFAGLRALDNFGAAVIFCPLPVATATGDTSLRAALRDRLLRAARTG